ncbi:Beta-lactamase-like protein 2 [Terramyces sp. JEL0728]|nr:Beta-lactamase-like protein 2 [Terramyces sp. JEL0728]
MNLSKKLTSRITQLTSLPFGPYSTQESHAYLVGNGKERVLIDTGTGHQMFIPLLQQTLAQEKAIVKSVLITHQHQGHFSGFDLTEYNVYGFKPHKKYPKIQILKDGQLLRADGITIKVVATPGHSSDHASFYLQEEECLFSGDSIAARVTNNETKYLYNNLIEFKKSLAKQSQLVPKICMQGHGDISIKAYQMLENALAEINNIDRLITDLLRNNSSTTKLLIEKYSEHKGIAKGNDLLVLSGLIRVHLTLLERDGIIFKRSVAYDAHGNADGKIKGPGGLEMNKIFSLIQESRKKDFASQINVNHKIDLHSIHSDYQISPNTTWALK